MTDESGVAPPRLPSNEPADLAGLSAILTPSSQIFRSIRSTDPDGDGNSESITLDVVASVDVPAPGYVTYASIGIRNIAAHIETDDGREIRSELVIAARKDEPRLVDVLPACADALLRGGFHLVPGTIIPNAIGRAVPDSTCEHALVVAPFLWSELTVAADIALFPDSADEPAEIVLTRLQIIPVSGKEISFAADSGVEALLDRLEHAGADVATAYRSSTV